MANDSIGSLYDEFEARVNMSVDELRDWKDSEQFDTYAENKSGGEDIEQPVDDAIRLLETPEDEWKEADDGFNEVEEAEQLLDFTSRMQGVDSGEPMSGSDPPLSKRDASLLNWGVDPNPQREDFEGDR